MTKLAVLLELRRALNALTTPEHRLFVSKIKYNKEALVLVKKLTCAVADECQLGVRTITLEHEDFPLPKLLPD
jgi:hypothetical protein